MELKNLTAEQRQALKAEIAAQEAAEKEKHEADVEAYKELVSRTVSSCFPRLKEASERLVADKAAIREAFASALTIKSDLYGTKENQRSHTFINREGTARITLGVYTTDAYDDTVEDGIAKVKAYISGLAHDEQSAMLVDTVLKLLSKDATGALKASRVLQLQQLADRSGHPQLIEGVKIIREAYQPIESKSFVKAEYKDTTTGAWTSLPLGMTEA